MKSNYLIALAFVFAGCATLQEQNKERSVSSVYIKKIRKKDLASCGLTGSIEERIQDCSQLNDAHMESFVL